ncbi:efflux RND transporter periplasmic adaptor subunit [Marinoscillum furvescens]|uniref:HlyD family secretion protein n=1 Tax=Marinoscillum furvescens DSM 4134 TaxID=1122208 RepID=A0A3D9L094_MARFU|nr:efflux RND transporter periplasmic adaptor subunit [Marinoscillum furvescens]RED95581.1 HlyD family secretion protein [Marinoscillum furvescens DSM 4134]
MAKKKNSSNKILYILGAVVIVLILVAVVGKSQGWVGQKKAIQVEIAKAERATIIEKVSASGSVQPVVEVKISPEVPGEIIRLAVEEGDSVSKGDFLVKVRPDNFISALERARANLNQQKANLEDAKARTARAEATYKRNELEFNRQKKLYQEKVISEADFQLAEANYNVAKQDLASAKQNVEAAKFVVQSAQASVNEAAENLRLTEIESPMNGIVSKLDVEEGETVVGTSQMQGTEMLRIADLTNMEVRVDVNENDIIRINNGDTAIIDVDSYSYMDKTFKGVVTQIANTANDKTSADAVTEFEVRIKILNSSYQDLVQEKGMKYPFRPGMTASVDILTETKRDILTVPLAAVTTRKAESGEGEGDEASGEEQLLDQELDEVVFKVVDGAAKKTIVKTGISDFERIEILEGIAEGEEVISGPFLAVSKRLNDGDNVEEEEQKEEKEED